VDNETANLEPAARLLADLVARVDDGELASPTPCPAYAVGDLIEPIGTMALAFTAAANKDRGPYVEMQPAGDASRLADDWRGRIPGDLAALARAWQQPGAWAGMTRIAGMDSPAGMVALVVADELAVHGWDLARATGQPYDCDPAVLDAALSFLGQFASPDAPAGPQVPFGPSRPQPADAPLLDRVVALAGRDPGWSPR
jgi:uncharacterized protein (TIGR03086 family)